MDDKDCKYVSSKVEDPLIDNESNKLFKLLLTSLKTLQITLMQSFTMEPLKMQGMQILILCLKKYWEAQAARQYYYAGYVTEYNGEEK